MSSTICATIFAPLRKTALAFYQATARRSDARVINDISASASCSAGVLNFVNAPIYYVYAMIFMLSMDVRMTLAALAPFPLLMLVARVFRGRIMKSSSRSGSGCGAQQPCAENFSGMHGQSLLSGRFSNPAVHRTQRKMRKQKHADGQQPRHRQSADPGLTG